MSDSQNGPQREDHVSGEPRTKSTTRRERGL